MIIIIIISIQCLCVRIFLNIHDIVGDDNVMLLS